MKIKSLILPELATDFKSYFEWSDASRPIELDVYKFKPFVSCHPPNKIEICLNSNLSFQTGKQYLF